MNGEEIRELRDGQQELGQRITRVETKVVGIEKVQGKIENKVIDIDTKITKNFLNDAVRKTKTDIWMYFIRVSTVLIMSALVTKLFSLW